MPICPRRFSYRWFVLLLALPFALRAEAPFSYESTPGRLPKTIVPHHYTLRIQPDAERQTIAGTALIDIEVLQPVTEIVLNALELEIDEAALVDDEAAPIALTPEVDADEQMLTLPAKLAPGSHRLLIRYRGKIGTAAQGFFVDKYKVPGGHKLMLGTQMEVADARRAFPCWDEPVFRATYDITLVVPEKMTAASNMPEVKSEPFGDGLKAVTFARTPSMPSYLVAMYVAEFESLESEWNGIKLRVLTTEGKEAGAAYPLAISRDILAYQTDYFGVPYPLPKLDHIGVPNAFSGFGAMENWGCITYIDTDLLFDPATSSQSNQERVYEVVAHETAHQWFGNIVTMAWWDNLWLNEGFASWLEAKTQDALNPEWQVWLRSNSSKEYAMALDARASTHPIQQEIENEAQAAAGFDAISYSKGQAFIRMLEAYLGEVPFRDGIRLYIKRHAYSNTTTADLWAALAEASGKPVQAIASDWTVRPGFPIVLVSTQGEGANRQIVLTQSRFTLGEPDTTTPPWHIPVTYATLGSIAQPTTFLVNTRTASLPWPEGNGPLKLNINNTGFYRVQYDDALAEELQQRITELPVSDQLNLLSDTWALVRAGRLPASRYLDLAAALSTSPHQALQEQILSAFGTIDGLQQNEPGRRAWQKWAIQNLHPLLTRYGWDARPGESPLDSAMRPDVINRLGNFGDPAVIATAKAKFQAYLENPASLDGNLAGTVFRLTGRYADRATYDQLHALARDAMSTQAKRRAYAGMQAALDPELTKLTLELTLGDEMPAAESNRNLLHLARGSENDDLVVQYAIAHYDELIKRVGGYEIYDYLPGIMGGLKTDEDAKLLMDVTAQKLPADALPIAARTAEGIRDRAKLKRTILPAIDAWVRDHLDQQPE